MKIPKATISRVAALVAALINQLVAVFGKELAPFLSSPIYQIVTAIITIVVGLICAWFDNDFTKYARMTGVILDALQDGEIEEAEVQKIVDSIIKDE